MRVDTEAKPALDPAAMATRTTHQRLGAMLGEARTAAGIDLADISRDSRIPLRHLRAIEADSHDALPALPYTIGFVKSFARAVGKDPEAAAAQFRAETTKTPIVPMIAAIEPLDERRLPPRGLMTLSIVGVLVIVGVVVAYSAGMFDRARPAAVAAISAPATDAAVGGASTPGVSATTNNAAMSGNPAVSPATEIATSAPSEPIAPAPPSTAVVAAGPVTITPTEDVWVKIYDRATNSTVKIGILPANVAYAVPATPGLLLWTGKAGMLKVSVGGRAIPPLGQPVETVRAVSLAPVDLLARITPGAAAPR
jgi:cytoskeleton protein RodZ